MIAKLGEGCLWFLRTGGMLRLSWRRHQDLGRYLRQRKDLVDSAASNGPPGHPEDYATRFVLSNRLGTDYGVTEERFRTDG